jgi:hypothetical protein
MQMSHFPALQHACQWGLQLYHCSTCPQFSVVAGAAAAAAAACCRLAALALLELIAAADPCWPPASSCDLPSSFAMCEAALWNFDFCQAAGHGYLLPGQHPIAAQSTMLAV